MTDYVMGLSVPKVAIPEVKINEAELQAAIAESIVRQVEFMANVIKAHGLNEVSSAILAIHRLHFNRERKAIIATTQLNCHESPSKAPSGNGSDTGAPAVLGLIKGQGEA